MGCSIGARFVCLLLLVRSGAYCSPTLRVPVAIAPLNPVEGSSANLTCRVSDFELDNYNLTWRVNDNCTFRPVATGGRFLIGPYREMSSGTFNQTLTISSLQQSDANSYLCVLVDNMGNIVSNTQGQLLVNAPEEFPVCLPEGAAVVSEGDALSCRTMIDERVPVVRSDEEASEDTSWIRVPAEGSSVGNEVQRNTSLQENGTVFFCFSILKNISETLSCTIGPLTVIPAPTTQPPATTSAQPGTTSAQPADRVLSLGWIIAISVVASLLLLLLVIHTVCCRCKPKRWLKATSYLLHFDGMFGGPLNPDENEDEDDEAGRHFELVEGEATHYDIERPAELGPVTDGEDDGPPLTPPVLCTQANIYSDFRPGVAAGPSSQLTVQDADSDSEVDLKAELAEAIAREENHSDSSDGVSSDSEELRSPSPRGDTGSNPESSEENDSANLN